MRRRKVLVVDDHVDVIEHLALLLAHTFDCDVRMASDERTALRMLEEEGPFDLVITDRVMDDEMSGLRVIQAVREGQTDGEVGTPPTVPIILYSGFVDDPRVLERIRPDENTALLDVMSPLHELASLVQQLTGWRPKYEQQLRRR